MLTHPVSQPHLSPQSQKDKHEEEEQWPEGWDGQQGEGFWVGHKGQSRAVVGHLWHGDVQVVRHEAQDGEYDEAGIHAGRTVGDTDDDAVSVCRIKRRENMWGINSTGKQMRYVCNLTSLLLSLRIHKTPLILH